MVESELFDVVIDFVVGLWWFELFEILKLFGCYVMLGVIVGYDVFLDVWILYLKDLILLGCIILGYDVFVNLVKYIEVGNIKLFVLSIFLLSEIY